MHTFTFSSAIALSPEAFWSSMTMASVNAELSPWVRMSCPRDWRQRPMARWATDRALFRSVIFLFGMLPVDVHSFRLERVHPGRGFLECSRSWVNKVWRHERTTAATPGGCVVTDTVWIEGRVPLLTALLVPVYRWIFRHRHRRLGALYGRECGRSARTGKAGRGAPMSTPLPKGQRARADFPRFGLSQYAYRFPREVDTARLRISGDAVAAFELDAPLSGLPRIEQVSDFHCVTTWSRRGLRWGGVRFADFFEQRVRPLIEDGTEARTVVLRGQDGYRTTLPLADLLAADVLLADALDGRPLQIEHGAPLRLVAPAHYGYKSLKHLSRLEFHRGEPKVKPAAFAFMDHPRARVALEERGRGLPGWLLRRVYRLMIRPTAARFARAMAAYRGGK